MSASEPTPTEAPCVFCDIVEGKAPAEIVERNGMTIVIVPLNPVTPGHLLVIPTTHVEDFTTTPSVSAFVMHRAAKVAAGIGPCNLVTSKGKAATQSVKHLHVHLVPRVDGDGLALPWTAPVLLAEHEREVRIKVAQELNALAAEAQTSMRRLHLQVAARHVAPEATREEIVAALAQGDFTACYLDDAGRSVARGSRPADSGGDAA